MAFAAGGQWGGVARFWPLFLTRSARTMTVVFIVVGAAAYVGYSAVVHSATKDSLQSLQASVQVELAYSTLDSATQSFKSATRSCTSASTSTSEQLHCIELADSSWAQAIQAYGSSISQVSYPSSAQPEAVAAEAAARNAVTVLDGLAASPDPQSYSAASSSQQFSAALDDVDSTYNRLVSALGVA